MNPVLFGTTSPFLPSDLAQPRQSLLPASNDTVSFRSRQPQKPLFGYDRKTLAANPDLYTFKLEAGKDFTMDEDGQPKPTPELAQRIADKMAEFNTDCSGFLAIPVPESFPQDEDKLLAFQNALFDLVKDRLNDLHPAYLPEDVEQQVRSFRVDDGQKDQGDGFVFPNAMTLKRFHIDGDAHMFSHIYFPFQNVTGGNLMAFDYRLMMKETGLAWEEIFEFDKPDFSENLEPMIRPEMREKADKYIFEVNLDQSRTGNIIFVNNCQISHGVTATHFPAKGDFMRSFQRWALELDPRKAWESMTTPASDS